MRVDLPDGEWAEFCAPRKVSDRRRRAFIAASNDVTAGSVNVPQVANPRFGEPEQPATIPDPRYLTGVQAEAQFHAFDLLILCFLKAWSFPQAVTLETVEDLDAGSKDVLTAKAISLMGELMPDYGADIDPKSPAVRILATASGYVNGRGDLRDPLLRSYVLTTELHIPPPLQDHMSAVDIDELIAMHSRIGQLTAQKRG